MELVDTDKKDRPLQDIKIVNSGELVLKKKKNRKGGSDDTEASSSSSSSQSSSSESESEDERRSKKKSKKKKKKDKKKSKRAKGSGTEDDDEDEGKLHPLAQVTEIDPDEIPEVTNKFLYRADSKNDRERSRRKSGHRSRSKERRQSGDKKKLDKDGKKVKGRGRMTFRATSRSRSGTPPHWKTESRLEKPSHLKSRF